MLLGVLKHAVRDRVHAVLADRHTPDRVLPHETQGLVARRCRGRWRLLDLCLRCKSLDACRLTSTSSPSASTDDRSKPEGLLLYRLLQQAAGPEPHPLKVLIGGCALTAPKQRCA